MDADQTGVKNFDAAGNEMINEVVDLVNVAKTCREGFSERYYVVREQ